MRLNHLDILEQVFHEKFRGYSKQEVETFLHLVADDFKEMSEEIQLLNKKLAYKESSIAKLTQDKEKLESGEGGSGSSESREEIDRLKKELDEKDRIIEELKAAPNADESGSLPKITPEMLKIKAKQIIRVAREQADQYTQKAEEKLSSLHQDIQELKQKKKSLLEIIRNSAKEQLDKLSEKKQ